MPVPGQSPADGPELTHALVAGQVEAQYIRLPGSGTGYSYGNGVLFQVEQEEDGAPKAVRWWAAEGDALVPLEGRATGFSAAWAGLEYTDTVYWCVYEEEVSCYCAGSAGMAVDYNCTVSPLPGRTDAAILTLSQGSQMGYQEYPMLLDLETGAVTDLLAGTGWEGAAPLREVQWRPDLSAAILSSDSAGWFYCDRAGKTTASLDALTGLEVFSAWFAPDGALLLLTRPDPEGNCYDVWTWDPAGGPPVRTFQGLPRWPAGEDAPCGFQFFFGGSRGLYLTGGRPGPGAGPGLRETAAMTGPLPDLSAASSCPAPPGTSCSTPSTAAGPTAWASPPWGWPTWRPASLPCWIGRAAPRSTRAAWAGLTGTGWPSGAAPRTIWAAAGSTSTASDPNLPAGDRRAGFYCLSLNLY